MLVKSEAIKQQFVTRIFKRAMQPATSNQSYLVVEVTTIVNYFFNIKGYKKFEYCKFYDFINFQLR